MLLEVVEAAAWKKKRKGERGGGNSHIFLIFIPENWGKIFSHFDYSHIFLNGLVQPPTSCRFC